MNNPAKIYIVRHAQSGFNVGLDRADMDLNSGLTELGIEQAREIAEKFKSIDFVAIFSSGLNRSKQTAQIIKENRSLDIQEDSSTNERSFYRYAKQIKREVVDLEEEMMNEIIKLDEKDKMKYKHTSEMESAEESAIRLLDFLKNLGRKYVSKNVLVVSHSNLMRSVLTFLGYTKYDELPTGSVKNTGYFVLETDGKEFKVIKTDQIYVQEGKIRVW